MRFTNPWALLLLLPLIPAFWYIAGLIPRGQGGHRERLAAVVRTAIALALVFSLAGFDLVRRADELAVVFLIDASDSMSPEAQAAAAQFVEQALDAMGPDDQAAVIVFGGEAVIERGMSPSPELGGLTSIPATNATDLAEAIRLGLALYPSGAARRMVILSDGAATTGDAEAAARLAAAQGVQIQAVPFIIQQPGPEALLQRVEAPERLRPGQRFDLRLTVLATEPGPALVRVFAGGEVVFEGLQELRRGEQSFSLTLTAGQAGAGDEFVRYQVQIIPEQDQRYQNNQLATFSYLEGPPRVLVVAPPEGEPLGFQGETRPDEAAQLVAALQAADILVETRGPGGLPGDLGELAGYSAVVMVDVPARQLTIRQMESLQEYVRSLGGGLVAVGGPTSYGVGGYYQTPLEETLPVEMHITDEQRRPRLAIVYVIDQSGSMDQTSGGPTKLELAKEAAIRSVELLYPTDQVGVVAFDDSASWAAPVAEARDRAAVIEAIAGIGRGGGTDILAGVQAVAEVLPRVDASLKHVILLTDGGADPTGIPELVQRMYEEQGITLSTIGIGSDAAPFLEDLAELGGGRYHFTADPSSIPQIFTEETTLATRAYIEEHDFFPRQASPSPLLAGIRETPQLRGYVSASAKDVAQVILESDLGDPILAAWQYGLGRAVAFTSDATARWAQNWLGWEGFPSFWAQTVDYVLARRAGSPLEVRVEHEAGAASARLVVEAETEAGEYLNGYRMQARVIDPEGETREVTLQQVAPGRYEGEFTPRTEGAYWIGVSGQAGGGESGPEAVSQAAGWVLAYSPEYAQIESDPALLTRLAAITGGGVAGEAPRMFAHDLPAGAATRPGWPWLLALAALLLPLDIALRRLALTPAEVRRGLVKSWANVIGLGRDRLRRPGAPQQAQRSARLEALFGAKQRAGERRVEAGEGDVPPSGEAPAASPPSRTGPKPEAGEAPAPEESQGPASKEPASTAASLLEVRRRRRQNRK